MRYEIRAMSLGEILDTGFRLLRDHFGLLVGIGAVLYVPMALLGAYVTPNAARTDADVGMLLGAGAMLLLYFLVVSPVAAAAITYAVGEVFVGRSTTISECLRLGFAVLLPLAGTTLLLSLAVIVGFLLFIIPGIYLALSYLLAWQVMVLEKTFGLAAMRRSRDLMRGHLLRGFAVLFVSGLIVAVVGGVVQMLVGYIPVIGPVGAGLAQAVTWAYTHAVTVVLYFDIRCRKEGFEVEHLARLVARTDAVTSAPAPAI